ncbi:class I SAM-dependent methyltransferase [Deltaproteobacteria bacterium TL4]
MLQMKALNQKVLKKLEQDLLRTEWDSMASLELLADRCIDQLRENRKKIAKNQGGLTRIRELLDRTIRTDDLEYLDDPDFPESKKVHMVRGLHYMNVMLFSYHHFLRILKPYIVQVEQQHNRPVRILELASGSGEFTLALASLAQKKGLPVEMTGSDIVEGHVLEGRKSAKKRRIPAQFIQLNAFEMSTIQDEAYDMVFIAQSIHHFSPGQLAMMMAQSQRICKTAFIGVDGYRSLFLLGFVPGMGHFYTIGVHDAWVTARKFYSQSELELIGKLAAPDAAVKVRTSLPGYSVITVEK